MRARSLWFALVLCAATAFLALAVPMYVIRPFRAQGARELAIALWVRAWGPYVATLAAALGVFVAAALWRRGGWRTRSVAALCAVIGALFAGLSFVNVFELMFHPMGAPKTVAAAQAKVDTDDMVIAVRAGGQARAYPVREMAYHHIANDWVGGQPIAATY